MAGLRGRGGVVGDVGDVGVVVVVVCFVVGGSADVRFDVCYEAALLAEGEVDSRRVGGVVGADLVGEGWVFGVGWRGWAGVLVEVDETASAFFE